jgi:iron complex outermembrane receptor protein
MKFVMENNGPSKGSTKAGLFAVRLGTAAGGASLILGAMACWAQAPGSLEPPASGQKAEAGLPEIVITATRRTQNLQDVPISVSAITGDVAAAAGITGTTTLQEVVPSLTVSRQGPSTAIYLRGLGSSSGSPATENSVAIYLDGVYQPAAGGNFFEFNNIERIEVLKGPQGTQFGRNATAGVIQVITKDPQQAPELKVELGYANYGTVSGNAYVSGGVGPNLAANLAVTYSNQSVGWGHDLFTGADTIPPRDIGVRGKLLWSADDATDIRLAADYSHTKNAGIDGQPPPGASNLNVPLIAATGTGDPYPGRYNVRDNYPQSSDTESYGGSLTLDHDFGQAQLKNIAAYNRTLEFWTFDQDLSPFNFLDAKPNLFSTMYTEELHLLSAKGSQFQWLVGAFYYHRYAGNDPETLSGVFGSLIGSPPGVAIDDSDKISSTSVFAQGTYPVLENTDLTLGSRYTWDKVDFTGTTFVNGTDNVYSPSASGSISNTSPTLRVSLDHKFTPDELGYVSYNKGVKSAGFDLSAINMALNAAHPFQEEKLNAYEAGLKSELVDHRVRLNVAAFYYDFKNIQFQQIIAGNGVTFNGPGAKMYGGEIELEAKATTDLLLNASLGFLHTRIENFPGAPNTCRSVATGLDDNGGFFCNPSSGLPTTTPFNAGGNQMPNAPKVTANVGPVYTIATRLGSFDLAGNVYYNGGSFFEIDNRLRNGPFTLINGSILWTRPTSGSHPNSTMTVRLWGKNLTDKFYYVQMTGQAGAGDVAGPAPPRTYGVTFGYNF